MNMLNDAATLSEYGHREQKRKYTNEPYFIHCEEVVNLAKMFIDDTNLLCALYCHDLLEDTNISKELIRDVLGQEVLSLVEELTDISKPEDGNRSIRKEIDRQHLAIASDKAQTGKCFDIISNTISITKHDKKFALIYLKEIDSVLDILVRADKEIVDIAKGVVDMCWMDLEYDKLKLS